MSQIKFTFAITVFALVFAYRIELNAQTFGGFEACEGVTSDGTYIYVSNFGPSLKAQKKDKLGYITKLEKKGAVIDAKFITGLNSPTGMLVYKNTLYVNSLDYLLGFDLKTKKKTFSLSFEGKTKMLNDITIKEPNTLFLSSTSTGQIFEVNLAKKNYNVLNGFSMKGVNGIYYDDIEDVIFVCSFYKEGQSGGELGKITFNEDGTTSYQRIGAENGLFDGIIRVDDYLILTDWRSFEKTGVLKHFDLKTLKSEEYMVGDKIHGPADFYFDETSKTFYIPALMESKLYIFVVKC